MDGRGVEEKERPIVNCVSISVPFSIILSSDRHSTIRMFLNHFFFIFYSLIGKNVALETIVNI